MQKSFRDDARYILRLDLIIERFRRINGYDRTILTESPAPCFFHLDLIFQATIGKLLFEGINDVKSAPGTACRGTAYSNDLRVGVTFVQDGLSKALQI